MANARATVERALRAASARLPDLFAPGTRLVVAFSGGQDSTTLLHGLRGFDLDLIAVHVDHALRPESASDAQRVLELGVQIGVPGHVLRVDVPAYRRRQSVQAAARAARYQALAAAVTQLDARALLMAHTADDQAETLLLNLMRGTGLKGLAGMRLDDTIDPRQLGPAVPEVGALPESVRVARPLLRIARATTLDYCVEAGLSFVADPSNQSRAYTRNRVRLDVLPMLERFNPAIREVLARTADLAADDEAALDEVVSAVHASLARASSADALEYDLRAWRQQPRGVQRRLLRRGLESLLGTLVDVPAAPIEDALDLVRSSQAGQAYHLPYGVELVTYRATFTLRLHGAARPRARTNIRGAAAPRV
ncbi:MAG TPA: tRNA lysidine(34) synthetase TilS [Chloroflexota bacterium]